MSPRIYLDNAASTPLDPRVLEAMLPYLTELHGNPSSIHGHGRVLRAAIEKARKTVADLLHCAPAELIFTSGGTEADNYALRCTVVGEGIGQLITSPIEHHAVTHTMEDLARRHNLPLHWLTVDAKGNVDLDELRTLLSTGPKALVSLMHGNNEIGTLNPIQAIADICAQYGAIYHADTVQTLGHLPMNLQQTKAHFIVGSAHKFYGPKGVGILYRREGLNLPSLISGGGQERNQRAGTENVPFIIGLAKALELCVAEQAAHAKHLRHLKETMMRGLQALSPDIRFNGETEAGKSLDWVLNVSFPGTDTESLLLFNLDLYGISASGGSACTSGSVQGSHVLAAIGVDPIRSANSVRFSFGVQNTQAEIEEVLTRLQAVLQPVMV